MPDLRPERPRRIGSWGLRPQPGERRADRRLNRSIWCVSGSEHSRTRAIEWAGVPAPRRELRLNRWGTGAGSGASRAAGGVRVRTGSSGGRESGSLRSGRAVTSGGAWRGQRVVTGGVSQPATSSRVQALEARAGAEHRNHAHREDPEPQVRAPEAREADPDLTRTGCSSGLLLGRASESSRPKPGGRVEARLRSGKHWRVLETAAP